MDARLTLFGGSDAAKREKYKQQIRLNLNAINFSDEAINKILGAVDKMPASSHVFRALQFLTTLTDKTSRCENHYLHSHLIAEYFCTLSNFGFFAVAYYYQDYVTLAAGIFSAVSHAVPLKRLNELDKIAAVAVFLKMISHYDVLMNNPGILIGGATALTTGVLDIKVGRNNLDVMGPVMHVAWHLATAFVLYQFNQAASNDMDSFIIKRGII